MNERDAITARDAPPAVGPYSHAIRHGGVLYCSGALPIDPESGRLRDSSLAEETEQCLRNLEAVCRAGGAQLGDAIRLTVFTTGMEAFTEINEAYEGFFAGDPPARVAVGAAALPKGARVEIDAMVAVGPA